MGRTNERWHAARATGYATGYATARATALAALSAAVLVGCTTETREPAAVSEPGGRAAAAAVAPTPATGHLWHDHDALIGDTLVQVVVEIPAGTNDKWQVEKESGTLEWEQENGAPRVIQYLAYPGSYGIIPQTYLPAELGGDGDPLDVLLLGPSVPRGAVVAARVIGVFRLIDRGERDDKILAVPVTGPLSSAHSLVELEAQFPGAQRIVELWFSNYKGPGLASSNGFADADSAMAVVREASGYYQEAFAGR